MNWYKQVFGKTNVLFWGMVFFISYISHIKVKFWKTVSGKQGSEKYDIPIKKPVYQSFSEALRIVIMESHGEKKVTPTRFSAWSILDIFSGYLKGTNFRGH